jgi:hypothetical protein
MKRIARILTVSSIFVASIVCAQDVMVTGKLDNVTQKISQKGNAYVILSVPENRELNGVKYTTSISVFSFNSEDAKKLKTGDNVKLVAKKSVDKNGNEFYTLLSIVK